MRTALRRASRVHVYYLAAYALSLIVFDSWNLITHEGIVRKWTLAAVILTIVIGCWFVSKQKFAFTTGYTIAMLVLIISGVIFAAYNVSWERGMASKSLILFIVPIVTAALTRRRTVLLATTGFSAVAYSVVVVRYFHIHYGEGFRVQVYGELLFYGIVFFVCAWLLRILQKREA